MIERSSCLQLCLRSMTINSDFCLKKHEKHIMYFSSILTVKHRLEPGVCCCCCCCLSHFVFVVLYSEYCVKLKRKRIKILNWLQRLTAEVSEFKLYDHIDMKESFYIRKAGFHPSQHRFETPTWLLFRCTGTPDVTSCENALR